MFVTTILCVMFVTCDASSRTHFKMLRGNGNNYTVENVRMEEDLEYPRNNRRILRRIQDMWQKYYECLIQREYKDRRLEIRRLVEGQYTELTCDICPRPFQNYEDLEWKYKPLDPEANDLEHLDLTPEMTYTENKTIKIYNAVETLTGLYVCYHRRDVTSAYILEVSKNDTMERVETFNDPEEHYIQSEGMEFQVSYRWTQWTECSACGRVGKKFKYGTCYVSPKKVTDNDDDDDDDSDDETGRCRPSRSVPPNDSNNSDSLEFEIHTYSCNSSREDLPQALNDTTNDYYTQEGGEDEGWDLTIIERFSTGIPCASQYLPKSVREAVRHLKSVKAVVKFCWEACRETEIFQVFDSNGILIESANNTAGVYSVFQKIPQTPHDIERRTIGADFGTDIIIQCPGTSLTNTPVVWKINKQILFPDLVAKESNGRFTIDLVNRIHLKKLRLKDSRIYSCWQREKLVGTVNLNVGKKFKIALDHHVTLIVIIAGAGLLLLAGAKALARELRMRKK